MRRKAPGRSLGAGLEIMALMRELPDGTAAEEWFEERRSPGGERYCLDCGFSKTAVVSSR